MIYYLIPILFFSIVIHEFFHGYVALKAGDPTAKYAGRLTLNPIPHIDPIGTIFLPLLLIISKSSFLFGWAKPVPVNPMNFRDPGKDNVKVAAAGPLSNFGLALVFSILCIIVENLFSIRNVIFTIFLYGIKINLVLAFFNLIPVPPLDGSHILEYFLPLHLKESYYHFMEYKIKRIWWGRWDLNPRLLGELFPHQRSEGRWGYLPRLASYQARRRPRYRYN